MNPARSRTLSLIATLRALGHAKPRRRLPRQQQPDGIRRDYFSAIKPVCDEARRAFAQVEPRIITLLAEVRATQQAMRGDDDNNRRSSEETEGASPPAKPPHTVEAAAAAPDPHARARLAEAQALIDQAARSFADKFHPRELERVAARFGKLTEDFSRAQLDAQIRAAVGVSLDSIERPVRDMIPGFVAENVALIKTVPERYFDSIREHVADAFASGTHPETLAEQLAERYDVSLSNARRIARDQIGKLSANVNQARQESLGVTHYIWRTMNDNRVRDDHRALEGRRFAYSDPPNVGPYNEPANPGEAIQCRCYAEPDFSALLAAD